MGEVKMDIENCFYVYEWFNKESNEVFYVGKGKKNRYKDIKSRNTYFLNYYNKYKDKCDVRRVMNKMTETNAFELEISLIEKYKLIGQCQCNLTVGGDGCTFPKDSWNHWFRKLQFLHDAVGEMDEFSNEVDYRISNLKTKTTEELMEMYEDFKDTKEGIKTAKEYGYYKKIDKFELDTTSSEIIFLTNLIAKNVSKSNVSFNEYITYKTELDFICSNINWDKFLNEMMNDYDYMIELYLGIDKTIRFARRFRYFFNIKIKSSNIKDNILNIRFSTSESNTVRMVNIDISNIIFGLMIEKDSLINVISREMFSAPFIFN